MKGVDEYFGNQDGNSDLTRIYIHLGVSGNTIMYEIEERGKNEKSFRVPDEQGEAPQKEPINNNLCIDNYLNCKLNVDQLVEEVNEHLENCKTHIPLSDLVLDSANDKIKYSLIVKSTKDAISEQEDIRKLEDYTSNLEKCVSLITKNGSFCKKSNNAGLFICNYCYYSSLHHTQPKHNCYSLFIHVPPHDLINIDNQIEFVKALVHCIVKQLS
ncbi:predicted protein [Naegleria gruberi]|uniref:Predicted protein n=1 Tax=Naegleria gruberi TaxID=5762 RepID=D2VSD8_NAEGR|nr:uncharacterized protein NAEGRDRAFT_71905 [Naegleria gruberi]EFC40329.1 predicted protein [Naegleria gruberi]|eukprot:XP_002673073.1 predicted protein [Naegleria gruberi strain NEG-M]